MTDDELKELEELRAFKLSYERRTLDRAFDRLEAIYHAPYSQKIDGVMSVTAFRALCEALMLLKQELIK